MLISSKGRYALRLMIYIAAFGDEEGKIALREVAEREGISLKYLEQLVRPLMAAGLLRSVRGKGGGYMLARPADEVRAGDILRAAEGDTAPVACDGLEGACGRSDLCSWTASRWPSSPACPSSGWRSTSPRFPRGGRTTPRAERLLPPRPTGVCRISDRRGDLRRACDTLYAPL